MKSLFSIAVLTVFAMCAAKVAAQTPPAGAITGVVRDSSGGVIPGAAVIAVGASGPEFRATSGPDGKFTVTPTGSGAVVLTVRISGFAESRQTIPVGGKRQDLEIVLGAAPLTETINVAAPMPPPPPPPPPPKPVKPPKPPAPPVGPVVNLWYAGLITGSTTVHSTGGSVGGEAGMRVRHNLDVLLEGGWFSNVVTSQQLDVAAPLTAFLLATTGKVPASSVKRPAVYGTVGARWVFEDMKVPRLPPSIRPYAQFGIGAAQVKREPTFTLSGTDVTSTLGQYGVILGADMTGTEHRVASTLGFGVLMPIRMLYVDVGYRLTNIPTTGAATNISRFHFGVGARF
jgi:Carboxypeptidase regulatory-like domain